VYMDGSKYTGAFHLNHRYVCAYMCVTPHCTDTGLARCTT
jgi:hypothetical protein